MPTWVINGQIVKREIRWNLRDTEPIKKFKCNFVNLTGFWHSIDNTKDIEVLKKINNKDKFNGVRKILKKIYKFNEKK